MPMGFFFESPDDDIRSDPEKLAEWQREFRDIKKYEEERKFRRGIKKQQFTFVGDNAASYMIDKGVDDDTHQPPKETIKTLLVSIS